MEEVTVVDNQVQEKKRKTVKIGGRSVSIVVQYNGRKPRRERFSGRKPFSRAFMREFGRVVINDERRDRTKSLPVRSSRYTKRLKDLFGEFIGEMAFKYADTSDPELLRRRKNYGFRLAEHYLLKSSLHKTEDIKTDTCKKFIEYGFFIRSVRGDSFIPFDLAAFTNSLDQNGNLDFKRISTSFRQIERGAGAGESRSDTKEVKPKFDSFIDYTLMTKFSDQNGNSLARQSAYDALDEAITKYGITSDNLSSHLRIALQHVEWGMKRGYASERSRQQERISESSQLEEVVA